MNEPEQEILKDVHFRLGEQLQIGTFRFDEVRACAVMLNALCDNIHSDSFQQKSQIMPMYAAY